MARRAASRGQGAWAGDTLAAGFLALVLIGLPGCSVRRLAVKALADSLAESGDVFASDNDPELVRDATPFALKTIEALLQESPRHRGLLLAACRGFAQYAYAFVEVEAERLEEESYRASRQEYERALKLYLRGRDYCLRSLELDLPGAAELLRRAPEQCAKRFELDRVELLFWTGAAWGGAVSVGQDRPEIMADLSAARALIQRVLELDEAYDRGAAHAVMIALEALPEAMGGSRERAREHFDRAVALSRGASAGPYVTLAENVSVATQDWREFRDLLSQALEIDPDREPSLRLANIIAQRRAQRLLERTEDLFFDYSPESGE